MGREELAVLRFSTCAFGHVHVIATMPGVVVPVATFGQFDSMEEAENGVIEMLERLERQRIAQLN